MSPRADEPVLLGSAILAAVAAGAFPDIASAMPAMSFIEETYEPASGAIRQLHDRRFDAFCRLQSTAREIRHSADQLRSLLSRA